MIAVLRCLSLKRCIFDLARVFLASEIGEDGLCCERQGLSALENWEQAHGKQRTKDPNDADDNPAGEELLAEDVAGTIHGHWPKDEERKPKQSSH